MTSLRLFQYPYQGRLFYFLTLCCFNRQPYFKDSKTIESLLKHLSTLSQSFRFHTWAYCFMPDHCHFLWQGTEEQSNLRQAVKHFKQSTGFYFQKRTGRRLWQKNYFDHILRKEEKIMTVCQYIFENPVRAGLVGDYRDYPYSGSMVFDWKNFPL